MVAFVLYITRDYVKVFLWTNFFITYPKIETFGQGLEENFLGILLGTSMVLNLHMRRINARQVLEFGYIFHEIQRYYFPTIGNGAIRALMARIDALGQDFAQRIEDSHDALRRDMKSDIDAMRTEISTFSGRLIFVESRRNSRPSSTPNLYHASSSVQGNNSSMTIIPETLHQMLNPPRVSQNQPLNQPQTSPNRTLQRFKTLEVLRRSPRKFPSSPWTKVPILGQVMKERVQRKSLKYSLVMWSMKASLTQN
ncbi:hypothetical protein FXO38_08022 [Capsicum annuum]|nr:hypothetical protein FXO38_08022 [Capsicum annuum]